MTSFDPTALNGFSASSASLASPFVRLVPDSTSPTVTMTTATFTFATPIQAFGVFITGLGTASGTLKEVIYDGGNLGYSTSHTIPGNPLGTGGAQFVGFTEPGAGITKVSFVMSGFTATSRDIIGLDGITFVAIPEPSSLALILGGLALLGGHFVLRPTGC